MSILIFEVNFQIPSSGEGGVRGSLGNGVTNSACFWGRGVVAAFLELLSSKFVCKYHFGANFDFLSQLPPSTLIGLGFPRGRGVIFSTCLDFRAVVATFLGLLSSNLVFKHHLSANFFKVNPPSCPCPRGDGGNSYYHIGR